MAAEELSVPATGLVMSHADYRIAWHEAAGTRATAGAVTHHSVMPVKRPLPMSCQRCQRTRSGRGWIRGATSASAALLQRVHLVMHMPQLGPQSPRALRRRPSSPCSTEAMTMDITCPHAEEGSSACSACALPE